MCQAFFQKCPYTGIIGLSKTPWHSPF